MTLFETIFKRRSVRSYDMEPLSKEELEEIRKFLDSAVQLKGCKAEFAIVGKDKISYNRAPHAVLAFCEKDTKQYINVGYVLQKLDLFLQSANYGSVWLGMPKPLDKENKENFAIMLAFGKTQTPMRGGESDFSRLDMDEIGGNGNTVSRAVRVAPSATNSQPWTLAFEDNKVTLNYFGRGAWKPILKRKMSKIDIGIALCHAEIALIEDGKKITETAAFETGDGFGAQIVYS